MIFKSQKTTKLSKNLFLSQEPVEVEEEDSEIRQWNLPHKFKRIGLIFMICAMITSISLKQLSAPFIVNNLNLLITILKDIFIIALLTVCISKQKVEDDLIRAIRLKSFMIVVMGQVFFIAFMKLLDAVSKDLLTNYDPYVIIVNMLLFYLITFYILRRINFKNHKINEKFDKG